MNGFLLSSPMKDTVYAQAAVRHSDRTGSMGQEQCEAQKKSLNNDRENG